MVRNRFLLLLMVMILMTPRLYAQVVHLPQEAKPQNYRDYSLVDNGFWCAAEGIVGSSVIFNHSNVQRSVLSCIGGYRFNEFIRIGGGLGVNCYFNGNKKVRGNNMFTMPVFFDVRGNFISQDVCEIVPYWSMDIGANLGDGFFFSPTIGIRIGEQRSALLLGANYIIGEMDTTIPNTYPDYIHFLGIKIGYEF